MAALTLITFDGRKPDIDRGTLFDCPAEFLTRNQIVYYRDCPLGWSICPLGYHSYAALDALGRKVVVPGIIIPSENVPRRRRFPNYDIRFEKIAIQKFIEPHLAISDRIRSQRNVEFRNLTHDLRAISTEIYHTALSVKQHPKLQREPDLLSLADTVLAAQQMMSVRLDIVDYEVGHALNRPSEKIGVFRKVEKVYKCFWNKMSHRRIRHRIDGTSYGITFGPPILEIVPFVILENAIKYAPTGSEIVIAFDEVGKEIFVYFESLGPRIKPDERGRIFNETYRGEAARTSERSGSGIGLYAAKKIMENQFKGTISVDQTDDPVFIDTVPYLQTRFTLVFPKIEDSPPTRRVWQKRRHGSRRG